MSLKISHNLNSSNMKRLVYSLLFLSSLLSLTSCADNLTLGYTPTGVPITLSINNSGIYVSCSGAVATPIGVFSLTAFLPEQYYNKHATYIELINRLDNEKYVIKLENVGETVNWESTNCKITVVNRSYSTIVTVESDKISNFLHEEKGKGAGYKPDFPETPIQYFYLVKTLNSHVNWEINSVADFFGDVIFAILWVFAVALDLLIIMILFILRFLWWVLLLLGYLMGVV